MCQKSIPNLPSYLFVLQDLLLGDHCCLDIMGSTQFNTPRANWDKRCCSNSRGPVVEIPDDVSEEDANKINKQIARMPNLKQVCTLCTSERPSEKLGWLSINQLACEVRLIEVWKALNLENHCLNSMFEKATSNQGITRSTGLNKLKVGFK